MNKILLALLFLGLLLRPGAAGAEPVDDARILVELAAVYSGCHELAEAHLAVAQQVPRPGSGSENPAAEYDAAVFAAEQEFLHGEDGRIMVLMERLAQLELDVLSLPPNLLPNNAMRGVSELCRLASTAQGATGITPLRLAIAAASRPPNTAKIPNFPSTGRETYPSEGRNEGRDRVHPAPGPISDAEYRRKKERWAAQQKEEEARELQVLRQRQEALETQKEEGRSAAEEAKDPKVALRKGVQLPPPVPQMTPEQVALRSKVAGWHKTAYTKAMGPFKMALNQVLTTPPARKLARREACQLLYTSVDTLNKSRGLWAPDPAVAAPAGAMAAKFQQAALLCVEGKVEESELRFREAEQEIGKMAAVLAVYGLSP